jgi:type 1 glutamine amidotransferase
MAAVKPAKPSPRSSRAVAALLALSLGAVAATAAQELFRPTPKAKDAVRVLLVTGGHDHDVSFYSVLDGQDDLDVRVDPHPNAFRGTVTPGRDADVVVLYDMPAAMAPEQEEHLRGFVEAGGGVVALHHAIAGRSSWRWWWEEVIGARYLEAPEGDRPASTYKHDVELTVRVAAGHPVTAGLQTFRILDETYKGMWISPKVTVLLTTDDATSDGPVAWVSPYPKARVVTIQLGHGREAHLHPSYRRLVRNAVLWASRRTLPPSS